MATTAVASMHSSGINLGHASLEMLCLCPRICQPSSATWGAKGDKSRRRASTASLGGGVSSSLRALVKTMRAEMAVLKLRLSTSDVTFLIVLCISR